MIIFSKSIFFSSLLSSKLNSFFNSKGISFIFYFLFPADITEAINETETIIESDMNN